MKSYAELKTLIEQRGVHEQLGPVGQGWNADAIVYPDNYGAGIGWIEL